MTKLRATVAAADDVSDEEAALDLSRRFHERLVVFAIRRLREKAAAEEVAQDTLWHVVDAIRADRLQNPDALPAFVFETARHLCQKRLRSLQREERALNALGSLTSAGQPANGCDPLSTLIDAEERAHVRTCLARLDERDREVLQMTFVAGLDSAEIARRTATSPGAVRVRRHRALNRLAELVDQVKHRPKRGNGR